MKLRLPSVLHYKHSYFRHDIIAALVVTALAIPQSLAFAVIVGLPPVTGLYTAMVAPIVFAFFAWTRRVVVGPDSATTAVVASGAVLVAQAGTAAHANAVAIICLLAAILLICMWLFRLGFLSELISRPVLVGFFAGVGLQLIITSLPSMFGIAASGNTWQYVQALSNGLGAVNGMALTVSILVVGMIIVLRKTFIPGELVALVLAVGFSVLFHLDTFNVAMVGVLPSGLPSFHMPSLSLAEIVTLLPAAVSVALVVLAQGASVIRSSAQYNKEKIHLNQDLFAMGLANAASALFGGFSSNGSLARTEAAQTANGKTQLVNILSGLLVGVVLLFGASLFAFMPQAALASIVLVVGFYLIRFQELEYIWTMHRREFFVALIALLGTLTFGVLQGVFIAVIVSLAERLSREYRPRDAVLLRDGEFSEWALERLGDSRANSNQDGSLVYGFDGSLFFENIGYFVNRVQRAVEGADKTVRLVVIDASAIDSVDYTAAEELKRFAERLKEVKITIKFAHVAPILRQQLLDFGIAEAIGKKNIHATLTEALRVAK